MARGPIKEGIRLVCDTFFAGAPLKRGWLRPTAREGTDRGLRVKAVVLVGRGGRGEMWRGRVSGFALARTAGRSRRRSPSSEGLGPVIGRAATRLGIGREAR